MSQSSSNAWDVFTIAAMMAIAAAVVGSSAPLQSSRPRPGMLDAGQTSEIERVPALLTRDPFDVTTLVTPQPQSRKEENEQLRRREAILRDSSVVTIDALANDIAGLLPPKPGGCPEHEGCAGVESRIRVRVLFNLLPGDGYAETAETRRRTRYAVASALHASGYMSKNSSRIGLLCLAGAECDSCAVPGAARADTQLCSMIAPFEIFERSRHYGAILNERCARCAHSSGSMTACSRASGVASDTAARACEKCCVATEGLCPATPHRCGNGPECGHVKPAWKPAIADVVLVIWAHEQRMLEPTSESQTSCLAPCVSFRVSDNQFCGHALTAESRRGSPRFLQSASAIEQAIRRSAVPQATGSCAVVQWDAVQTVLIGPRSSDSMRKLLSMDTGRDLVVLSPTATASFLSLSRLQKLSTGRCLLPNDQVRSVIVSDEVLSESIVSELARRGILSSVRWSCDEAIAGKSLAFGHLTQHKVLILGESDHPYVRLLRWQYVSAFERYLCPKAKAEKESASCTDVQRIVGKALYHYDYFRQIDTEESPGYPSQASSSLPGPGAFSAMQSPASTNLERPEGRSQIDYIRRIIDSAKRRLADEPHGTQIVAVGVIATDPYDKLLILQAVRKAFPHAVFFVHDVDARLFHPRELPFTRNTIIAASYGLDPDEVLSPSPPRVGISAPTMRDSHQSATYVATHHAVTQCNECLLKTFPPFHESPLGAIAAALPVRSAQQSSNGEPKPLFTGKPPHDAWPRARIYEIGREGVVRLDPPPVSKFRWQVALGWATAFVLAVVGCGELHRLWPIRTRTFSSPHKASLAVWFRRRYLMFTVGGIGAIGLLLLLCYDSVWAIEPVGLTTGVSAWPVIFLYALAAYAAFLALLSVFARAKMIRLDLGDTNERTKPMTLWMKWGWFFDAATQRRYIPQPQPVHWALKDDLPNSFWRRICVLAGIWPRFAPAVRDIHGWAHPPLLSDAMARSRFWCAVQSAFSRRSIALATALKTLLIFPIIIIILLAFGPEPDGFRWARDEVRNVTESLWCIAFILFLLAVFAFREFANVIIRLVSHVRWNPAVCPSRSITDLVPPSGPPEVRAVLIRARMIEDLATEVARLAVLVLFVLLPMIVSQSKIFERMVFSPMVMILLLIPSLLWLMPLAILQTRVRSSRGELVEELLEIKRGFLQANPPLGASDPSVASVDAAIRTVEAGGGPMAKPLLLGPFAKLLIPVVGGLALLAMHVLWGPY